MSYPKSWLWAYFFKAVNLRGDQSQINSLKKYANSQVSRCIAHTVNSGSEMVEAKHVSGKNIFWSTLTVKSRGGKIFEFVHCPFEGRANMHHKIQPNWLTGRCCLAGGSKGQCRKSKIFLSLLLPMQVDQYIFFPETCFAPTISEPEFAVCLSLMMRMCPKISIQKHLSSLFLI